MEPEDSLPCSQEPTTFPIMGQISPVHALPPFCLITTTYACLPSGLFHSGFATKFLWASHGSHACYMSCPPHPHRFGHPNNV
jgi:hypothetical protein